MSKQLFNNLDSKRGSAIVTVPMHTLYNLLRERLKWVDGNFDPDALCQNFCCEVEKQQGTYPNVDGLEAVVE